MPGVEFGAVVLWIGPYGIALLAMVYICIKTMQKIAPQRFSAIGGANIARGYAALSIPAISFGATNAQGFIELLSVISVVFFVCVFLASILTLPLTILLAKVKVGAILLIVLGTILGTITLSFAFFIKSGLSFDSSVARWIGKLPLTTGFGAAMAIAFCLGLRLTWLSKQ